jgi:hypothetical protein
MNFRSSLPPFAALLVLLASAGCAADTTADDDALASESSESDLSASRIQQLGTIASGTTKTASYTSSPLYRAYSFTAKKGDSVDIWVRSANGDAVAWLLRANNASIVRNDDATAATQDAHLTAKIGSDGQYFIAFKEAKGRNADFTVSFTNKPASSGNDAGAPDSGGGGAPNNDAFDPTSCTGGAPLDLVSKFAPGASEAVLSPYQIVLRKRQCNSVTGCSPWQATTEHAGPSGHGQATLAVNPVRFVLVGDEASSAYGTAHIKLGTECALGSGTLSCNDYYVTETSHGAWPFLVGPRERHYRVGNDGVGSYHIEGDSVKLAGVITNHCARLTAHPTAPDPIYPDAPYVDFEAAILIRY